MKKARKFLLVLIVLLIAISTFTYLINSSYKEKIQNNKGEVYAGSEACRTCHATIYDSFAVTSHFNDSHLPSDKTIKGSFEKDHNYILFNYDFKNIVVMEKHEKQFFQTSYIDDKKSISKPFDIVIGSGTKGQSYLYWEKNSLFQLPVSYFTPADSWMNSPGYSTTAVNFNRVITLRCLECHTTFLETETDKEKVKLNKLSKDKMILGIGCERCHGPAQKHVSFQTENPSSKIAKYIINPKKMSSFQQMNSCGLCHAGPAKSTQPAFSFSAGDTLEKYFDLPNLVDSSADVHGNQYQLISASKCFLKSEGMNCSSCHNTHNNERGNLALFSSRCMTCHSEQKHTMCSMKDKIGNSIKENCIDCHMPNNPSKNLVIQNSSFETPIPAMVRTHLIKIYPEQSKKIINYMVSDSNRNGKSK